MLKKKVSVQPKTKSSVGSPRLTHPDKIIYSAEKLTKQDIADYYQRVSDLMMPHLKGRPLSLYRCPNGSTRPCFYQKHATGSEGPGVRAFPLKEKAGTKDGLA
ncbi:MAG: DNA ligase, partial [Pedobacter sp.]